MVEAAIAIDDMESGWLIDDGAGLGEMTYLDEASLGASRRLISRSGDELKMQTVSTQKKGDGGHEGGGEGGCCRRVKKVGAAVAF